MENGRLCQGCKKSYEVVQLPKSKGKTWINLIQKSQNSYSRRENHSIEEPKYKEKERALNSLQSHFFQISLGRVSWKKTLEDPPLNGILKALSIMMSVYRWGSIFI